MARLKIRELAQTHGHKTKTVTVPEWEDAKLVLREPFVSDWDAFNAAQDAVTDDSAPAERNLPAATLLERLVFDEDGNNVFEPGDAKAFLAPNYGPVHDRLAAEIIGLSPLLDGLRAADEAAKKPVTPASDSE